jgi:hypothetical protein
MIFIVLSETNRAQLNMTCGGTVIARFFLVINFVTTESDIPAASASHTPLHVSNVACEHTCNPQHTVPKVEYPRHEPSCMHADACQPYVCLCVLQHKGRSGQSALYKQATLPWPMMTWCTRKFPPWSTC